MPIEHREEAPQLISRSISRRPCRWHPYTPPNTVPAQQSSGQGKLSSVIPWASTHTRTLSLEELGPVLSLRPHDTAALTSWATRSLPCAHQWPSSFPSPPLPCLPQPYLSSPLTPIPSHGPFQGAGESRAFFLSVPPIKCSLPRSLCVFRQRDLAGGATEGGGDRGFPCVSIFGHAPDPTGAPESPATTTTPGQARAAMCPPASEAGTVGGLEAWLSPSRACPAYIVGIARLWYIYVRMYVCIYMYVYVWELELCGKMRIMPRRAITGLRDVMRRPGKNNGSATSVSGLYGREDTVLGQG